MISSLASQLAREAVEVPPLAEFVDRTVNFTLHGWQHQLCAILERARTETGLRILIHGPPQYGKSIIVSQRFPAWMIGANPNVRIGLACYNESHSAGFGDVVRTIAQSDRYREYFPNSDTFVGEDQRMGFWFTEQRKGANDAQPSFLAMGLLTGFTGKGVDLLIVDDPYKSADEAASPTINEKVWRWWSQTASVRIAPEANVVVMFHRYHADDFAGRLLEERLPDGRKWEHYRFPAVADDNRDGSDPTGREPGELLSPMRSRQWLNKFEQEDPLTFMSQFQGAPHEHEGTYIKSDWFKLVKQAPLLVRWYRAWDIAFSKDKGDWTVGILGGVGHDGTVYIADVFRKRIEGPEVRQAILDHVGFDPPGTYVCVEKSTASLSIVQDLERNDVFNRVPLIPVPVQGRSKWHRASGWATRAMYGKVKLVTDNTGPNGEPSENPWITEFLKECARFKNLDTDVDDQVDAMSVLFHSTYQSHGGLRPEKKIILPGTEEYYAELQRHNSTGHRADDRSTQWEERRRIG